MSLVFLLTHSVQCLTTDKVTLNSNMTLTCNKLPAPAGTISEAFSEGLFYGRFRANIFYFDWYEENHKTGGKKKDNRAMGIGGSLIYKSAPFKGISGTVGLYTSQAPGVFREDKPDVGYVKCGKDTFNRNRVKNGGAYDGDFGLTVLGQAYLQYDILDASVIAGRQLFESVFTASNDTKMVPNTFDGISTRIKGFSHTELQLAWFTAQKLRDHEHSHDVIAFDSWNENDDSGGNKSLTTGIVGLDNQLLIAALNSKWIENISTTISYLLVPDILSVFCAEAHYKIPIGNWRLTPGMRFMMQMDELNAGTVAANLLTITEGYTDPDSLCGRLYAARIDIANGPLRMRLGYTKVSDDADLIAPWRGFPTGGFTRAMAQVNWLANTETYMIRCDCDFDKAGLVPGSKMMVRYAVQNYDDLKTGVPPDSNVIQVDILKELTDNLEIKVRLGIADGDKSTIDMNGDKKADLSYNDYRLEFNYLF